MGVGRMGARLASVVAGLVLLGAPAADAKITVTASNTEALFSVAEDPDCRTLNATPDAALPRNVIRLRATVVPAVPPGGVRYQWSLPDPEVGVFAADLPLDPDDTTFSLRSMCAEYGNRCLLTKDQLPFYNQPTILWLAPSCDTALPEATREQFRGETVTFRVKARAKKRSLGKGAARVRYGGQNGVTVYVDHDDGIGRTSPIPTSLAPFLSARLGSLAGLPAVSTITIEDGVGGATETAAPEPGTYCASNLQPAEHYDACADRVIYESTGKVRVLARAELEDGSVLCDANTLSVQSAENRARVHVETTPRLATYVPGDPRKGRVTVKVTLFDESLPPNGGLFFTDGPPLSCDTKITIGKLEDSRSTSFDFRRCSGTQSQGCNSDGDCPEGQTCLVAPHCSVTVARPCATNVDCTCDKVCEGATDPTCREECEDERCVHVLSVVSLKGLRRGESLRLYEATVDLLNLFPSDALIEDTWTVTPLNAAPASATVKYRIKKPKNAVGNQRR